MNELQVKKNLLEEALKKKSMDDKFTIVENNNLVLFRSFQDIYGSTCLAAIILSNSAYTMINIFFGKLESEEKRNQILELINNLNTTYSANKFILSESDELVLQVPYVSLAENFDGEIVIDLLRELLFILLKKEYIKFQEILGDSMMIDFRHK